MNLREKYRQFRAWQQNPFDYSNRNKHLEHCANCGTEFSTNFCPVCGQKAGVGPIDWRTVRQGLMQIWGMDNRSLGYSLVQLVLRPGYLISDYISGKRQVSFPPVKMLMIVAVGVMIVDSFLEVSSTKEAATIDEKNDAIAAFGLWFEANPGWGMLVLSSLMLIPTWFYFRYAPKHRKHTLPEGFFIQTFMSSLLLLVSILVLITDNNWFVWLLPICYLITYRQLFGYGWWGTLWRTSLCCIQALILFVLVVNAVNFITGSPLGNKPKNILILIVFSLVFYLPCVFFWIKNKRRSRE